VNYSRGKDTCLVVTDLIRLELLNPAMLLNQIYASLVRVYLFMFPLHLLSNNFGNVLGLKDSDLGRVKFGRKCAVQSSLGIVV
jgi:hypothetical protein